MHSTPSPLGEPPEERPGADALEGPTAVDYVYGVVRRARRVLAAALAAGAGAAVLSLLMPAWYAADATFLPSPEERSSTSITTFLYGVLNPGRALPELVQSGDLSVDLMRSRRLREPLVHGFDLIERYGVEDVDAALAALDRHIEFQVRQVGVVTVTVEDRDPVVAAALANALVDGLDRFNAEQRMTRGRRTREFVEEQLELAQHGLHRAEAALERYQVETKAVPLSPDVRAAVDAGASLLARKVALEIEFKIKSAGFAEGSEELRRIRSELVEVERKLEELPALNLEFARHVRDVRVREEVYGFLRTQLEDAKIREQEDTPSLTIVDLAEPPALRSRPRRKVMVLTAATVAGLLAALGALAATYVELLPPEGRRRRVLDAIGRELGDLWPGRRRRRPGLSDPGGLS